jgi:hypoxanthine phosphoribosyltransferase
MKDLQEVFDTADQLYSLAEIDVAMTELAQQLTVDYADKNPLMLCVMNGSVITAGHLLPKLPFQLELDYIHVTRYGDKTVGGELNWLHKPASPLEGRHVVLMEDIFDEGVTVRRLREYCVEQGVASVSCITLIDKLHTNKVGLRPEYIGMTVPNRYVFGFGMDYKGFWRNAPGIYAVKGM